MARREVKTYEVRCDAHGCAATAILIGPKWPTSHEQPVGWEEHLVDGRFGSGAVVELCPACARAARDQAKENAS